MFKLIRYIPSNESEDENNFDWDISARPIQRLYLSHDTTRLMEVINNIFAVVYRRYDVKDDESLVLSEPS